jgi:hypothetical protein
MSACTAQKFGVRQSHSFFGIKTKLDKLQLHLFQIYIFIYSVYVKDK